MRTKIQRRKPSFTARCKAAWKAFTGAQACVTFGAPMHDPIVIDHLSLERMSSAEIMRALNLNSEGK